MTLTIAVLSWGSPTTLQATLESYRTHGLFDYADNRLIHLQEVKRSEAAIAERYGFRPDGSSENIGIGGAFARLVAQSRDKYFLFLENDWQLIVTRDLMVRRIDSAVALLESGRVDCVRFRHREDPGEPLYSRKFEGRELDQTSHLLECVHWIAHPEKTFPTYIEAIRSMNELFYVANSSYANYTNNPCLYRTEFLREAILPVAQNASLTLEPDMDRVWAAGNYRVAQGEGLFSHRRLFEAE